jgi:gamma-glutamyltranspeptidase/glutathione hydrolase
MESPRRRTGAGAAGLYGREKRGVLLEPLGLVVPGMLTKIDDGSLVAPFGVMGGFMQPQGHVQVVVGMVDDHLDPQAALDRPRFCISGGSAAGEVYLEEGIPVKAMAGLAGMGHPVVPVSSHDRKVFGRGQVILRQLDSGVLWGGSDPRADGCAMCR